MKFHQRHTKIIIAFASSHTPSPTKSSLVVANSQMDSRRWKSIRKMYHIRNELAGILWDEEGKIIRFDALTQLLRHRRCCHKHHEFWWNYNPYLCPRHPIDSKCSANVRAEYFNILFHLRHSNKSILQFDCINTITCWRLVSFHRCATSTNARCVTQSTDGKCFRCSSHKYQIIVSLHTVHSTHSAKWRQHNERIAANNTKLSSHVFCI